MRKAVIITLICVTVFFLGPALLLFIFDPIPSRNKARLTQALSNCRQFSLAAEYYQKEHKTIPTIDDLIASKTISRKDAIKLLEPPGIYTLYFPPEASASSQPIVEYFSELGTAKYSPGGTSGIKESKK